MKVIISNEKMEVQCTIYDTAIRIPVKGDWVCYTIQGKPDLVYAENEHRDGVVEKVMIDYVQDIAIVTVKET